MPDGYHRGEQSSGGLCYSLCMSPRNVGVGKTVPSSSENTASIGEFIAAFSAKDGYRRQLARQALVRIGRPCVNALIEALGSPLTVVRWEAADALGEIREPSAAPALVNALRDQAIEVRWVAAEGLIALGRASLEPLLRALIKYFGSLQLREGAHHVLYALNKSRQLNKDTQAVLKSLRSFEPVVSVPWAAQTALDSLTKPQVHESKEAVHG